ncbi:leucine-rich repeats and immunoglobulin-like domains protein 1 isoform X2 [Watersipora subatra]|uniref:leucine-rich repeats and immunoglobulin-like domains protein 1 isoform X2 n=1 Tax=Watersipora subatra TaxID=2589382 RepID=UPI00355C4AF8
MAAWTIMIFSPIIISVLFKSVGSAAVDLASLPNFDTSTPQNVTVYQGETARLPCTVHNMQDKKVSWFRKGLTYPLAVSTFSFLSDGRHVVENNDEQWNLIIKDTTKDDSGIYLCRVMTQTMLLAREITLNVLDHPATVAPAVSLGDEPIIYVTKGMELRLQCNSTGGYERNTSPGAYMVPPEVEWFKGDGNKIDSHSLNNVVIHNQIEGVLLMSTLVVEKAQSDDAGVYICRNTGDAHAEVTVRVLNDDRGNKKRGTASDNPNTLEQMGEDNSAVKHFSSVVLILGLLICNMT